MTTSYENIQTCRVSGSSDLISILELGEQPLANALKDASGGAEDKFPLTLMYCPESSLVQLKETIDKEVLFSHYTWVTGTSQTTRDYARLFCQRALATARPEPNDFIIEIASNDGTFLMPFLEDGYHNILGVDPAKNIVETASQRGVRTLARFWGKQVAEELREKYGHAKMVMARNVIPHVSELHDVVAGIAHALRDDGIGIIEFHNAGQILEELHYDSIYHEHLCYFSIKSITCLLALYELVPFHIDTSPISGGSYAIYFSKQERQQSENYSRLNEKESQMGVNDVQAWKKFAESCHTHRDKSIAMLEPFSSQSVLGFGASARSSTYLNFCGFGANDIKAIIDNNPLKHGRHSPGTSIPIVSFAEGMQMSPDLIFILAWNFRDEIIRECRANGYRRSFLVAFPHSPHLIKDEDEIS
jgi:hypothetical protein